MSEKLYHLLLRLYPSRFRTHYAAEAMQVFRDRLRDERGLLKRARLWIDVLFDVSVSAPREHHRAPSLPAPSTTGLPSFMVLEEEPLRFDKFLFGTLLALLALATFGYLLTHGGNRVGFPGLSHEPLRSRMARAANFGVPGERRTNADAGSAPEIPIMLTNAERELVLRRVIVAVREYDPDRAEWQRVTRLLEQQDSYGTYDGILDGHVFAALLTEQISRVTRRMTVTVLCGQQATPGSPIWVAPSTPGSNAWQRIDDHFSVALAPPSNP